MTLLYAASFTKSLDRLAVAEQKQVKISTMDLMLDPTGNGLQLHRVEKTDGFWTARVSRDIRIVLHKDGERTLLAYVDHHDAAYAWAERRRLVPHDRTGAMQFVVIPERSDGNHNWAAAMSVGDDAAAADKLSIEAAAGGAFVTMRRADHPSVSALPFAKLSDDQLLNVGVPRNWLDPVRAADETSVEELFDLLPDEAAEALLDFATGGQLEDHVADPIAPDADPFTHPDAQRRFRMLDNLAELRAALDQPFERWAVFLHPVQRALAMRDWSGPARVSGSAGTGKTIVALHRAAYLARADPAARVLLTTFSKPLATALARKLDVLTEAEPDLRARITVRAMNQAAYDLYAALDGQPTLVTPAQIRAAIADAREAGLGGDHSSEFLFEEWDELVDAWNVDLADQYAMIPRLGRRTRLGAKQREAAWSVFDFVRRRIEDRRLATWAMIYARLTATLADGDPLPFTHVVVDEAQDLSVAQVRFLAEVARRGANGLFLAGDIGQRIFRLPFSWARLGLDVRGRSHALKVNYRTSHQIRSAADRLLPGSITDLDGIEEGRGGTVSVFDGPEPIVAIVADAAAETRAVADFLVECASVGIKPDEIGILVRGDGQLGRARAAAVAAGLDPRAEDGVTITTMHTAKGLEFRAVAVMACDEDVLPDPMRLAAIGDGADLEAAYDTERHLLYVACTRARDRLIISAVTPGSEFIDDLVRP